MQARPSLSRAHFKPKIKKKIKNSIRFAHRVKRPARAFDCAELATWLGLILLFFSFLFLFLFGSTGLCWRRRRQRQRWKGESRSPLAFGMPVRQSHSHSRTLSHALAHYSNRTLSPLGPLLATVLCTHTHIYTRAHLHRPFATITVLSTSIHSRILTTGRSSFTPPSLITHFSAATKNRTIYPISLPVAHRRPKLAIPSARFSSQAIAPSFNSGPYLCIPQQTAGNIRNKLRSSSPNTSLCARPSRFRVIEHRAPPTFCLQQTTYPRDNLWPSHLISTFAQHSSLALVFHRLSRTSC